MSIPVYGIAAWSGVGKTTFISALVRNLKSRGIRVGVLKHDAHDFQLDLEGKDTFYFSKAGADVVAIASANRAAIMENRRVSFNEILSSINNVDIVLVEGYKYENIPKIGLYRALSEKPLAGKDFCCIVTDTPIALDLPQFGFDDVDKVAEFLLERESLKYR